MYKSPIEILYGELETKIEKDIMRATQSYGINVDKAELIRALQYDRNQYEKGYEDAKAELVLCEDCVAWCPAAIAKAYGTDRYCTMTGYPTKADDFCSYGERRTVDETLQ